MAAVRDDPALEEQRAERFELAARLRDLLDAAREGGQLDAPLRGVLALPSGWRFSPPLPGWLEAWAGAGEESLRGALVAVVDGEASAEARFERFAAAEHDARAAHGLEERPVLALLFGSMLNFALEPEALPVMRRDLLVLQRVLGYDPRLGGTLAEQYANRLAFARHLRAELDRAGIPVRDMIDVDAYVFLSLRERNSHMPRMPAADTIQLLGDDTWTMTLGERAAFEGILSQLAPRLAVEIGAGQGGSLQRLAVHCAEVHEIDLQDPFPWVAGLDNVVWHKGDSRKLLPAVLGGLADADRNVDFVLVDGDHSVEGVRRDMQDLMDSPAVGRTIILAHDTINDQVREGLEAVDYRGISKVAYVDLDFVPGIIFRQPSLRHQLWGGLGLIVVDADAPGDMVTQDTYYETYPLIREMRERLVEREATAEVPES